MCQNLELFFHLVFFFLHERIIETTELQGLVASKWRFSPGYCDWNVNQQEMIFKILNDDTAGVSLTDDCLMIPGKSVSGIIGIGDAGSHVEDYNPCVTCIKEECPGRRT